MVRHASASAHIRVSVCLCVLVSELGGHPRTLEAFLQECGSELSRQVADAAQPVAPSLAHVDFSALIDRVIAAISNQYDVSDLPDEVVVAVMISALLGDVVSLPSAAHPAHPEWTYRRLNDKGYLVLEPTGPDDATFSVCMPFFWLRVYLRRLTGLKHPLHAAFAPLRPLMDTRTLNGSAAGSPFRWQGWADFNRQFLALRINLLKYKHALLPALMPSEVVTAGTLFRGALISPHLADRLVQLPRAFVTAEVASPALSQQLHSDAQPQSQDATTIRWDQGTAVAAGGAADHFFVLLSPPAASAASPASAATAAAADLPTLVCCQFQDKDADRGVPMTAAELASELNQCKESAASIPHLCASTGWEFRLTFALFVNRSAVGNLDARALPPNTAVVLADQYRSFHGHTFMEGAKLAAALTIAAGQSSDPRSRGSAAAERQI